MGNYSIKKENDKYVIYDGESTLKTPGGKDVTTLYKPIADRIIKDLNEYGYFYTSASCILSYHFTMIENFEPLGHDGVVQIMCQSFLSRPDWTCVEQHGAVWKNTFGDFGRRNQEIRQWLDRITTMQLTAACCIGNYFESINIAYELSKIVERYPAGKERNNKFELLANLIHSTNQFAFIEDTITSFEVFELYYGIHFGEKESVLNETAEEDTDISDKIDVDDLTKYSVATEQLIGRNFYHYTDCEKDVNQPAVYAFPDLELDEAETDDTIEEDIEDEADEETESLDDYLPDDCWVKRFADDYDSNVCYILYIKANDKGNIIESGCIEEISERMGGCGMIFMVPGIEMPSVKSYNYNSCPPEKVINDLKLLFANRYLSLDFSFEGRRLPQKMIDEGGNGGSNTEYTYALQSAYRLAYMHMCVNTTEEGIIEGFDYSSYQSSGSEYGDMFSRPVSYSDRRDEAMDMLLYLYDMYSSEELLKR